jgi:putative membrane protein
VDQSQHDTNSKQNANDHLANERTLLAWIRTAVGIMVFGFVVVKFSLFAKVGGVPMGQPDNLPHPSYSGPIGIILVAVGSLSLALATLRYRQTRKQIETGSYETNSTTLYIMVSCIIVISIVLILFLLKTM